MNKHDEEAFGKLLGASGPDTSLPPGFEERLFSRMKAAMRVQAAKPAASRFSRPIRWWLWRTVPIAALAVAMVIAGWWMLGGGVSSATADFAEVLRRVRQANTVVFDQILLAPASPETRLHVQMSSPGSTRVTRPDGRIQVMDHRVNMGLTLIPATKTARLIPLSSGSVDDDPLDRLKNADVSGGRLVGREKLGSRETLLYQVTLQDGSMRVWVDPQDELPVRIEVKRQGAEEGEVVTVLENFSWNLSIPDSEFALQAPPGYTLEDYTRSPSEESLVGLLRICAQLGGRSFPSGMDSQTILRLVLHTEGTAVVPETGHGVAIPTVTHGKIDDDQARKTYRDCLRGLAFIEQVRAAGQWQYTGAGVKLGDASAIVCWWRPTGSASCRAVYGDLQIRDVPADRLRQSTATPP
jgi:hypothetical protein